MTSAWSQHGLFMTSTHFRYPLSRGAMAAQKFGDLGMTALLGKTESRLSVVGLGVQIRAAGQQDAHDSQVPIGRRGEERRVAGSIPVIRFGAFCEEPRNN